MEATEIEVEMVYILHLSLLQHYEVVLVYDVGVF
jgi:hypothetical protein